MNKDYIKNILLSLKTLENTSAINRLLKSLDEISDEELQIRFSQSNITEDNVKAFLTGLIERNLNQEENTDSFIPVNEWFCYGRTGETIHMHLIPKDLRDIKSQLGDEGFYNLYKEQLEDFLAKLQAILKEDETIKSLFAVSPIFYNPFITVIHENLGFDRLIEVDLNNENDGMSKEQKEYFINMFNKGVKTKKVYYTKISREKMLGMEYSQISDEASLKH